MFQYTSLLNIVACVCIITGYSAFNMVSRKCEMIHRPKNMATINKINERRKENRKRLQIWKRNSGGGKGTTENSETRRQNPKTQRRIRWRNTGTKKKRTGQFRNATTVSKRRRQERRTEPYSAFLETFSKHNCKCGNETQRRSETQQEIPKTQQLIWNHNN